MKKQLTRDKTKADKSAKKNDLDLAPKNHWPIGNLPDRNALNSKDDVSEENEAKKSNDKDNNNYDELSVSWP